MKHTTWRKKYHVVAKKNFEAVGFRFARLSWVFIEFLHWKMRTYFYKL